MVLYGGRAASAGIAIVTGAGLIVITVGVIVITVAAGIVVPRGVVCVHWPETQNMCVRMRRWEVLQREGDLIVHVKEVTPLPQALLGAVAN